MANQETTLPIFLAGQPISAADLNRIVSAIAKRIIGGGNVTVRTANGQIVIDGSSLTRNPVYMQAVLVLVEEVQDDVLLCRRIAEEGEDPGPVGEQMVVAKPLELRRSYYDGQGISNGLEVVNYTHVGPQARTAVGATSEEEEDQVIIPQYTEGVTQIYAARALGYGTIAGGGIPVAVDLNNAGRIWSWEP